MKSLLSFSIRPSRVLRTLGGIILILACLSMVGQYAAFVLDHERLFGFVPEFDLKEENNIPTYFSALMLLSASILLGVIAHLVRKSRAPFHRHWLALSVIFVCLSIDETASLHERLGEPVRAVLEVGGAFTYAWVIPGLALVAVFGLAYVPFFLHLPRRWQVLFGSAGALFVLGALGVEMLGAWHAYHHGVTFTLSVITAFEESLEMAGSAMFVYALLDYLRAHISEVMLSFDTTRESRLSVARQEESVAGVPDSNQL